MQTVRAFKSSDGEWLLDVLGNPYGGHNGGKDSDGEYFSIETKFHEDKYALPPVVYYHGYDEGGRPSGSPQYIGKTISREQRADGVWYRVALDKANQYAQRVWDAAKQGLARASSGSIAHLVRKTPTGEITEWPVAELSIFDAIGNRQPANQYAVALPVMKAVYLQAGIDLPDDIEDTEPQPEASAEGAAAAANSAPAATGPDSSVKPVQSIGDRKMEEQQINDAVAAAVASAMKAQLDAQAKAKAQADAQAKAVQEQVDAALKAQQEKHATELEAAKTAAAADRRLPSGAPYVAQFSNVWKYDDLEPADAAVLAGILSAAKMAGRSPGVSEDLLKYIAIGVADREDKDGIHRAAKSAMKMAGMPLKANELNQSTLASYGDEWVGVTYSTQLWDKIRLATPIVGMIPTVTVPQGSESVIIPLNGASPTFFKVAQASAQDANPGAVTETVTSSKFATTNKTLTVAKLGASVNYTGELEEDSLIPWVSELRRDLTAEAAEVLEHIVIDGDTAAGATTNINDIGGTPAGNEAFLLLNGFRKSCLVTTTANSRSAGTLAVEDFLETLKLMGLAGRNAVDKRNISFIVDMWTHWKSLELTEVKTRDVFVSPTIENGMLTNIYGVNVITSANMHRANQDATYGLKANTSGKVDLDTASNNTTGSILAVRWDQWRLGYKRRMTFEIERFPRADATGIVVQMRVGMIQRDTEASAISYGVTV